MLTLIKHELKLIHACFILPFILGAVMIINYIYVYTNWDIRYAPIGLSYAAFIPALIAAATFPLLAYLSGNWQITMDRRRKAATFFCTLATTRTQLMAIKLIVAAIWIVGSLLPLLLCFLAPLFIQPALVPIDYVLPAKIAVLLLLLSASCYSLGLWAGSSGNVVIHIAGMLLSFLIMGIIVIKGMNWDSYVILSVIAAAATVNAWHRFMKMPL